jgi:hypothetical protein
MHSFIITLWRLEDKEPPTHFSLFSLRNPLPRGFLFSCLTNLVTSFILELTTEKDKTMSNEKLVHAATVMVGTLTMALTDADMRHSRTIAPDQLSFIARAGGKLLDALYDVVGEEGIRNIYEVAINDYLDDPKTPPQFRKIYVLLKQLYATQKNDSELDEGLWDIFEDNDES